MASQRIPKHSAEKYREFAYDAVLDLVMTQGAAIWDEVEAKTAESKWTTAPSPLDPHHLTTARKRLGPKGDRLILEDHSPSTTVGLITTLQPADQRKRKNEIAVAARRKRALQSRYISWAEGNTADRARIGPAGEWVFHSSLLEAAPYGLRPEKPEGGEVKTLFGKPVAGGPLDNAAWLTVPGETGPPKVYLLTIEVKNVRSWIYPPAEELYQVLDKSARLSNEYPDVAVVPVLVCRRSSYLTHVMAKELGFVVLQTYVQPIVWGDEDTRLLTEVTDELAYNLLPIPADPLAAPPLGLLVGALSRALPGIAERTAKIWRDRGCHLGHLYSSMRAAASGSRLDLMENLKVEAAELGAPMGWAAKG